MATDERERREQGKLFAANKHRTGVTAMLAVDPRTDWQKSREPLEREGAGEAKVKSREGYRGNKADDMRRDG